VRHREAGRRRGCWRRRSAARCPRSPPCGGWVSRFWRCYCQGATASRMTSVRAPLPRATSSSPRPCAFHKEASSRLCRSPPRALLLTTCGDLWVRPRTGTAGVAQPLGELGEVTDVMNEWVRVSLTSPHHTGASLRPSLHHS
jgi:hypothetical protein